MTDTDPRDLIAELRPKIDGLHFAQEALRPHEWETFKMAERLLTALPSALDRAEKAETLIRAIADSRDDPANAIRLADIVAGKAILDAEGLKREIAARDAVIAEFKTLGRVDWTDASDYRTEIESILAAAPESVLARRDATKMAEALEEVADEWADKQGMSWLSMQARSLRQRAAEYRKVAGK